jgi:copper chaperone CopZ
MNTATATTATTSSTTTTIVTEVRVLGMSCRHCEHAVRTALLTLPGVIQVGVDVAGGRAVVDSVAELDPIRVGAAVDAAGYDTEWPA